MQSIVQKLVVLKIKNRQLFSCPRDMSPLHYVHVQPKYEFIGVGVVIQS